MNTLKNLNPNRVFYYFEEISKIPRCSHNERAISDFLKNIGNNLGLETIQDENLNIIIRKPATKGYENSEGVVIQGHMDMVCEKEDSSEHDFSNDAIELVLKGDFVTSNQTTLGADNGIAIAMGLAILEDNTIEHPSIELLVTSSEETTMNGAFSLDENIVKGTRLFNIDSEEEGLLVVGSAGGELIEAKIPLEYEYVEDYVGLNIIVRGLSGGHSGIEIHKPIGNAITILNETLNELLNIVNIKLISIDGGTKDNAIPRQAIAHIAIKDDDLTRCKSQFDGIIECITEKHRDYNSNTEIIIERDKPVHKVLTENTMDSIIYLLYSTPTGPFSYIQDNKKIVESSCNLAIVSTQLDNIIVRISLRSSSNKMLKTLESKIITNISKINAKYDISGVYPPWEYNPDSALREKAVEVYENLFGEKMQTTVIHAGLECGVLMKKFPHLDIISFGPNMYEVHTPKERLSISSTERTYRYLIALLKSLK